MTPLPKRRHSSRRQGKRRAALSLPIPNLTICPYCHQVKRPHQLCPSCGKYKQENPATPSV